MPMDPAYQELELEIVKNNYNLDRGVWQEMAKNPRQEGTMPTFPGGTPRQVIEHRMKKNEAAIGAKRTQVLRTKEGE